LFYNYIIMTCDDFSDISNSKVVLVFLRCSINTTFVGCEHGK